MRFSRLAVIFTSILTAQTAPASEALRTELAVVAKNVAQLLRGEGQDSVSIGQFTGPPQSTSGPGMTKILCEEFEKQGIAVKKVARIGVKGEFTIEPAPDPMGTEDKVLAVRIRGSVVDQFGKVLTQFNLQNIKSGEFERVVPDTKAVMEAGGLNVALPMTDSPDRVDKATGLKERDAQLAELLKNPKAHVANSVRLSATPKSPYAIEIWIAGKPREIKLEDGLAFCDIQRGEAYGIKLYNNSSSDAAAQITIDGLSDFAFSELRYTKGEKKGEPLYNHWIVPARKSAVVAGWHRNNKRWDTFLVTEYAKSAAAELKHTSNIGSITVTFAAAWPKGGSPPQDEPMFFREDGQSATALGPPQRVDLKPVEREIGLVRASVTVRYERPEE